MAEKTVVHRNFVLDKTEHARGALGVVKDVRFVRCLWPRLDRPTALFAEGSSGIEVMGPPTPRNVVFPPDTVFLMQEANDGPVMGRAKWRTTDVPTKSDCFFERVMEMQEVLEVTKERRTMDVGLGETAEIEVPMRRMVMKEVEVMKDLTVEQAMAMANEE